MTLMTLKTLIPHSGVKYHRRNRKWELEVYSETQMLKTKQSLRGQRAKIQTAGWQEGNYLVRVKYKNEILTAKLLVKR
jgi:hypothetical protein